MGWPLDTRRDYEARTNDALLFVEEGDVSKLLPPGPVHLVSEPWVVRIKLWSIRQDLVGKLVKVLDPPGEPGHSLCIVLVVPGEDLKDAGVSLDILQSSLYITSGRVKLQQTVNFLLKFPINYLNHELIARNLDGWSWFNVKKIDLVFLEIKSSI